MLVVISLSMPEALFFSRASISRVVCLTASMSVEEIFISTSVELLPMERTEESPETVMDASG